MKAATDLFGDSDILRDIILGELQKQDPPEDRSGNTLLQRIATHVANLPMNSDNLSVFTTAACALLNQVQHLGPKETKRLVTFLGACKKISAKLRQSANEAFNQCAGHTSDIVSKRADIWRLSYKLGIQVRITDIERDSEVRILRPWVWFDVALATNPADVRRYIREFASLPDFAKAIDIRLAYLKKQLDENIFRDLISETCLHISKDDLKIFKLTLDLIGPLPARTLRSLADQQKFAKQIEEFIKPLTEAKVIAHAK